MHKKLKQSKLDRKIVRYLDEIESYMEMLRVLKEKAGTPAPKCVDIQR